LNNKILRDFLNNGVLNIEDIVNSYSSYIYAMLKNNINSSEDIEEIISDVFVALWHNYRKLEPDMKIKPYLIGITKNLIKKKYRELSNDAIMSDISDFDNSVEVLVNVEDIAEGSEKSRIIMNALNNLKYEEKQTFIMFYYNSKKVKEIAELLGISKSKVKTTLHRVRKKLKSELKKGGYSYE